MRIKSAMHEHVDWVGPDTPITEIAMMMRDHDIGSVPVGENDRLIGMVTDRDIVCRGLTNGSDLSRTTARDVMTQGIVWCREGGELEDALHLMEEKHIRRLPVINDDKRMVGMLSLGDVSHAASLEMSGEVMQAVSDHHA